MDVGGLPGSPAGPARRPDRAAAPWTRSSPRRSPAASSRPSPTRFSTTRRWRSGARRRSSRGGSLDAQHLGRARHPRSRGDRARAGGGLAAAGGRSSRSTRRCCGWGTSPRTKARPGSRGSTSSRPPGASCARATAGSPSRRRAIRRRSCGAGWRPWDRSSSDDPLLRELEAEGVVLRTRIDGREAWCNRRLLARIHRYTLERLRKEIEPVTAAQFLRFLACWQHVDPEHRLEGPHGVRQVVSPARRVRDARRGLGGQRAAGARARLPAGMARPVDSFRRSDVGASLGRCPGADPTNADLSRDARGPRRVGLARPGRDLPRAGRNARSRSTKRWSAAAPCSSRSWRVRRTFPRRSWKPAWPS